MKPINWVNLIQWFLRFVFFPYAYITLQLLQEIIKIFPVESTIPNDILFPAILFFLITVIVGIGGFIIDLQSYSIFSKEQLPDQIKIERIIDIYRKIINDLRTSIKQIKYEFDTSYGFVNRHFDVIKGLSNDSTMSAVEGFDPELNNELKSTMEKLYIDLQMWERYRRDSLKTIKKDWIAILEESGTNMNVQTFVDSLFGGQIWEVWRGNIPQVREKYDQELSQLQARVATTIPPVESTFTELTLSAFEHMNEVRRAFESIEDAFTIIEDEIIPRMEKVIKAQFE